MNYKHLLHRVFDSLTSGGYLDSLFEGSNTGMELIRQEAEDFADDYCITDASTDGCDSYGRDYDLPRRTGESNADYKVRLIQVLRGKGVTKAEIKAMVDSFLDSLGFGTCNVYEWFDTGEKDRLDPSEFRVDLPSQITYGLFEGQAFLGYYGPTRTLKDSFLNSVVNQWLNMNSAEIRRIVDRFKAGGTKFQLSMNDYTVEE